MKLGNQVVRRFAEYEDSTSAYSGRNRDAAENPFSGPCGLSHDRFFTTGSGFEKRNVKWVAPRRQPGEKPPPPPCPTALANAYFLEFSLPSPRPNSLPSPDTPRASHTITHIPPPFAPPDHP